MRIPAVALLLAALLTSPVVAEDYFLTIGGGYSPQGNQISLEKNVLWFRSILAETHGAEVRHDVFFADGKDPGRDLQFRDPGVKLPRANELLAQLYGKTRYLKDQYRDHQVDDLAGASTKKNLDRWFDNTGKKLRPGDRLFVYVTAHGGSAKDKKKKPQATGLYLWNVERIEVDDLAAMLDRVNPEVDVVMVMVQCYSGGFANLIFEGGDPSNSLSPQRRCGFFATTHDRVAAGCTSDIREENYAEYSTYFLTALSGRTRLGKPAQQADFDRDGRVSFAEAHAYALIHSVTLDISISARDAFLRKFSKKADKKKQGLTTPDEHVDELFKLATPAERAVITRLSAQLKLDSDRRAKEAGALAKKLMEDKEKLGKEEGKLKKQLGEVKKKLRRVVAFRWPELSNPWHAKVREILKRDGEKIAAAIEQHADFPKYQKLSKKLKQLSTDKMNLDRRWVKCQRLIRTLENIALAENLPKYASPEVLDRYEKLLALESQTLASQAPTASE